MVRQTQERKGSEVIGKILWKERGQLAMLQKRAAAGSRGPGGAELQAQPASEGLSLPSDPLPVFVF